MIADPPALHSDTQGFVHVNDSDINAVLARLRLQRTSNVFLMTGKDLSEAQRDDARALVSSHFACGKPDAKHSCFFVPYTEQDARKELAYWFKIPRITSQVFILPDAVVRP